jgi:hypothetical protein
MTEAEWEALRQALAAQFDEDVVQMTLLALLEQQTKGVVILDPLRWCRVTAKNLSRRTARRGWVESAVLDTPERERPKRVRQAIRAAATRAQQLDLVVARAALHGHEAQALEAPLSPSPEAIRKRRERRRRRALEGAA